MRARSAALVMLVAWTCLPVAGVARPGETELVSVSAATGTAASGVVHALSRDARFVVFGSDATDLVPGGGPSGLFVRDRLLGTVERIGVDTQGAPAEDSVDEAGISADGRYVVFVSFATHLVSGDTNGTADVFVHDRVTHETQRVSVDGAGAQANGPSDGASITPDGRHVLFQSQASNLVAGDDNESSDVFVRDRELGTTVRVSVGPGGLEAAADSVNATISDDGRIVAFQSSAANLVPSDTNAAPDIFVRDLDAGVTCRVSVSSAGAQAGGGRWPASLGALISGNGRYVAFASFATNLVAGDTNGAGDVFLHDRQSGTTERVSVGSSGTQGNAGSWAGPLSVDGRLVSFESAATNLVPGDANAQADVFVRDRDGGTTQLVTLGSLGVQANGVSYLGDLSGDGQHVAFTSAATNLVPNDSGPSLDAFVHELGSSGAVVPYVLEPPALDFGVQTVGVVRTLSVTFTNTSGATLKIASIQRLGTDADQFDVAHACGSALVAGSACTIRVTFHPTTVGQKWAQLRVTAGANVVRSVALTGDAAAVQFELTPSSLSFGNWRVGTASGERLVTVRNAGRAGMPIRWIGLLGADAAEFRRVRYCPTLLAPGRTCVASVRFHPTSAGPKFARLVVSPGAWLPQRSVVLTGNGT